MSQIFEILEELSSTTKTTEKTQILEKYKEDPLLKQVLNLAYNPRIKFFVNKIPEYDPQSVRPISLETGLNSLSALSSRELTGNNAVQHLKDILGSLSEDDAEVLKRIIKRNLRSGVNESLINKTFGKNFIPETPYMGCRAFDKKLVKKLFDSGDRIVSQKKADGKYTNVIIGDGEVYLEARSGEAQFIQGKLVDDCAKIQTKETIVLHGELVYPSNTNRHEANGMVSSIISINTKIQNGENVESELKKFEKRYGTDIVSAQNGIQLIVWDVISIDGYNNGSYNVPYSDRLETLKNLIKGVPSIQLVETKEVQTQEQAFQHFKEVLQNGEEGTVIKSLDKPWTDGKPNYQIKLKAEMTFDLKIVGFNQGDAGKKYENTLGSIIVESSDGILCSSVGSGFDESGIREEIWNNQEKYIGRIVEIQCNGLSKNQNGGNSMLFPVFLQMRDDKHTADSFQDCKRIERMSIETAEIS